MTEEKNKKRREKSKRKKTDNKKRQKEPRRKRWKKPATTPTNNHHYNKQTLTIIYIQLYIHSVRPTLTVIDELVSAVEKAGGGVDVIRVEADDDSVVEGDPEARGDAATVPASEGRVQQVLLCGVLDLRVDVQVLVVTSGEGGRKREREM